MQKRGRNIWRYTSGLFHIHNSDAELCSFFQQHFCNRPGVCLVEPCSLSAVILIYLDVNLSATSYQWGSCSAVRSHRRSSWLLSFIWSRPSNTNLLYKSPHIDLGLQQLYLCFAPSSVSPELTEHKTLTAQTKFIFFQSSFFIFSRFLLSIVVHRLPCPVFS